MRFILSDEQALPGAAPLFNQKPRPLDTARHNPPVPALIQLQRIAGNRTVQGLIQRQANTAGDKCKDRGPASREAIPPALPPLIYSCDTAARLGTSQRVRCKRPAVGYAQGLLNRWLGNEGLGVDCWFGTETDKVTKAFQVSVGLDDDGKIGNDTWPALESVGAQPPGAKPPGAKPPKPKPPLPDIPWHVPPIPGVTPPISPRCPPGSVPVGPYPGTCCAPGPSPCRSRIDVRGTRVTGAPSIFRHSFIVHHDGRTGEEFAYRGGNTMGKSVCPGVGLQPSLSCPVNDPKYGAIGVGPLKERFRPGATDWPALSSRALLFGSRADTMDACFKSEAARISKRCVAYSPCGPNSNSVAYTLLVNCGVTRVMPPDGTSLYPGWGTLI